MPPSAAQKRGREQPSTPEFDAADPAEDPSKCARTLHRCRSPRPTHAHSTHVAHFR